jgi:hypothetical protein
MLSVSTATELYKEILNIFHLYKLTTRDMDTEMKLTGRSHSDRTVHLRIFTVMATEQPNARAVGASLRSAFPSDPT